MNLYILIIGCTSYILNVIMVTECKSILPVPFLLHDLFIYLLKWHKCTFSIYNNTTINITNKYTMYWNNIYTPLPAILDLQVTVYKP